MRHRTFTLVEFRCSFVGYLVSYIGTKGSEIADTLAREVVSDGEAVNSFLSAKGFFKHTKIAFFYHRLVGLPVTMHH